VSDVALAHRGHVKDFEGDGVLLYFDSAVDAAEAALATRAALDHDQCDSGCGGGPAVAARLALTVGDVAVGMVGPPLRRVVALVGPSINLGARLLKAVPPGSIAASSELVATPEVEAPSLARRFRLIDHAYEVPGAGGLSIAVYALAGKRDAATANLGPASPSLHDRRLEVDPGIRTFASRDDTSNCDGCRHAPD
jgi:class 3 adenylate cyclase